MTRPRWEENTRQDLEALDPMDRVVCLPTGAIEQHGNHLPVGTDSLIAEAIVHAAADRTDDVLALPALPYGYSPHHGGVAGTVTLSSETFLGVLEDVLSSLVDEGFERIVIVNGHGGNRALLKTAVSDFRADTGLSVAVVSYWDLIADEIETNRTSETGGVSHGGEMETALLLHLREELVGEERADFVRDDLDGHGRTDLFGTGSVYYPRHFDDATETGVSGHPSAGDPDTGERLYEAAVEELIAFIGDCADW